MKQSLRFKQARILYLSIVFSHFYPYKNISACFYWYRRLTTEVIFYRILIFLFVSISADGVFSSQTIFFPDPFSSGPSENYLLRDLIGFKNTLESHVCFPPLNWKSRQNRSLIIFFFTTLF